MSADPLLPSSSGAGTFRPAPAAAPWPARVLAQARFDARTMLTNGEQLVLTLVLPVLVLLGVGALSDLPDLGPGRRIDLVTPGVVGLALMSTAFTGQAIVTGFDRRYGVLRLLGTTPLGRRGLLAGRVLAVLAVEAVQWWCSPPPRRSLAAGRRGLPVAAVAVLLGTAAFVSSAGVAGRCARRVAGRGQLVGCCFCRRRRRRPAGAAGGFEPVARLLPSGALVTCCGRAGGRRVGTPVRCWSCVA